MSFPLPDRYYNMSPILAWLVSIGGMLVAATIISWFFDRLDVSQWYWLLLPVLLPLIVLITTPLMRVSGLYKYYSPLFLVLSETKTRFEIHSGPSIDYLIHLRGVAPGDQLKRSVLAFYLQGLLKMAEKIEGADTGAKNGTKATDVAIVGTSYFFSDSSVERMGFKVSSGSLFQRFNLILNFPELTLLNSLAAGKLAIPNILKVKKATMTGQTLLEHREYIQRLYDRLATERNRQYLQ